MVRLEFPAWLRKATVEKRDRPQAGGRLDFDFFLEDERWKKHAPKPRRKQSRLLSAVPAPAGEMTVVLGNGWPGVLIHEAVGHSLEGDFNRKGTSAFSKMIGQKVASDLCTIIDDGTVPVAAARSISTTKVCPRATRVLIEKGVLKGYLQDRTNGNLMRHGSTGNGRRESYRHVPMPRMTNTYLAGGQSTRRNHQDPSSAGFTLSHSAAGKSISPTGTTFSATSAILIEDGKLTTAVRGSDLDRQRSEVSPSRVHGRQRHGAR